MGVMNGESDHLWREKPFLPRISAAGWTSQPIRIDSSILSVDEPFKVSQEEGGVTGFYGEHGGYITDSLGLPFEDVLVAQHDKMCLISEHSARQQEAGAKRQEAHIAAAKR